MILEDVCPGDIIMFYPSSIMDADVPLFVLACSMLTGEGLHTTALYMVESGIPCLTNIIIDDHQAKHYYWLHRCKGMPEGVG